MRQALLCWMLLLMELFRSGLLSLGLIHSQPDFSSGSQGTMSQSRYFHLHLISDATGETLNAVARAAAAQYADHQPVEHIYALVRTAKQLHRVLGEIERQPGVVLFTIIDQDIRKQLETKCNELSIPCISILDPVIASLGNSKK